MASISLPGVPEKGEELEDYIAALFQSASYFVEKNITDENVLELDVVATSYEEEYPSEVLVEAKNGAWGFSDIFKVIGWMRYLGIDRGAFFVSKDRTGMDPASIHEKVSSLKMSFVHMGDFSDATRRFKDAGYPSIVDSIRMSIWRYAYWAERNLLKRLKAIARDDPYKEGPVAALNHHRLVNDLIFFTKSLRERLSLLYTAYSRHPRLACGIAIEMAGGKFDPEMYDSDNRLIKQAMYDGLHDQIQACFYLERRARLAILKTAVDYECLVNTGRIAAAPTTLLDPLPTSLKDGVERIKKDRYFKLYPLFWQVFLWGFGGFYLEDRKEADFKWLSEQTGVPAEEIPRALEVFDVLFPLGSGSWITSNGPSSQCMIVKMVPTAFRGLGANQRRWRNGFKEFSDFNYSDYTGKDLRNWSNSLVQLLRPVDT